MSGSNVVGTLVDVMNLFRQEYPDITCSSAAAFCLVATHNGRLTVREISDKLGQAQSSASRHVALLSRWQSFGKAGLDLIEAVENPENRREKLLSLTPKGVRLMSLLQALLK